MPKNLFRKVAFVRKTQGSTHKYGDLVSTAQQSYLGKKRFFCGFFNVIA